MTPDAVARYCVDRKIWGASGPPKSINPPLPPDLRGRLPSSQLSRSRATTTTVHGDAEDRQRAQGQAAVAARRRAEGALGGGLRAVVIGSGHRAVCGHRDVGGDVDVERKFSRELIGAGLQIAGLDELPVAEDRAALVVAGGGAGIDRIALAGRVVVGLTAEHAVSRHLFHALVLNQAHAFGGAVGGLIGRAARVTARIAVMRAVLGALVLVAAEITFGHGALGTVVGAFAGTDLVRALSGDGVALRGARLAVGLRAGRRVGCRAIRAARAERLLRADLLDGRGRARARAVLDWLEFAGGRRREEDAATLVERLGVRGARQ